MVADKSCGNPAGVFGSMTTDGSGEGVGADGGVDIGGMGGGVGIGEGLAFWWVSNVSTTDVREATVV